jgi:hypothetical protein
MFVINSVEKGSHSSELAMMCEIRHQAGSNMARSSSVDPSLNVICIRKARERGSEVDLTSFREVVRSKEEVCWSMRSEMKEGDCERGCSYVGGKK